MCAADGRAARKWGVVRRPSCVGPHCSLDAGAMQRYLDRAISTGLAAPIRIALLGVSVGEEQLLTLDLEVTDRLLALFGQQPVMPLVRQVMLQLRVALP